MNAALTVSDVSVSRGRREVVHDVSLEVAAGEIVAVLGPNGAGKSTLVQALGGLLPRRGAVDSTGRVATLLQAPGLARRTALANVELALTWWGVPRPDRRGRALEALAALGAADLARRRATTLSGGEQRRVHLARGLAVRPEVLLLDEPFSGLDPESHRALCEDTLTALQGQGAGVLVVLHDQGDAWALADRILVLMDGRMAALGTPTELIERPPTRAVAEFLGYDGCVRVGSADWLTRPGDVLLDPEGPDRGVVTKVIRRQAGALVEVRLDHGLLRASHPRADVAVGDEVGVRRIGGVKF